MYIYIYIYKSEDGLNAFNGALFTAHTAAAAAPHGRDEESLLRPRQRHYRTIKY